jgi:DNA invertase Pin-like site-specific DNA recombinase
MYGYTRVSTIKQGQGVSLTEQKEAISRYAVELDSKIVQWFEEKETAAERGRPIFNKMLKMLRARKADGVIIHKIDRSARNLRDWEDIKDLMKENIEVHIAHERIDLTARGGILMGDIHAVIASDYIRNLKEETKKGLYGRLKQGIYPFQAPTGYLNTGGGNLKTINPVQGPLVRQAFELYATRAYSFETLAEHMHSLGLRNLRNGKIKKNNLPGILKNSFYMGIIKVNGMSFKGGHEPLISAHLYDRVQAIIEGKTNQKPLKHNYVYRKLITCKGCGYSMIGEKQKGNVYYRCHATYCPTTGLRESMIEQQLLNIFSCLKFAPLEEQDLDAIIAETERDWGATDQRLQNSIQLQINELEQKLERLTDCYLERDIDKDTYEKRKESLLHKIKSLEEHKKVSSEKTAIMEKAKKYLELVKNLKYSYINGIPDQKRKLLNSVTSNFNFDGKKLEISMVSPFTEIAQRDNLLFGAPDRTTPRTKRDVFVDFGIHSESIIRDPLSKDKLRQLFDLILEQVATLADLDSE